MGWRDNVQDAKTSNRGVRLGEGTYLLKIEKCTDLQTRKDGDAFIADFEVMESTSAEHPVGSKRNWYQQITGKESALGNIKSFAVAVVAPLLGFDPTDEAKVKAIFDPKCKEVMDAACGTEQLFRGKYVRLVARKDQSKPDKDGVRHPFLRMTWAPYRAA